ncbi:MAG: catabolic L-serine/threonine dehydratase, partial [Thelocarpon impressellum]
PERAGRPDAVVCSVGGGGLLNGVVAALDAAPPFSPAAPPVAVLGVETRGAHSLAHAIAARRLVALPAITSIATSLGAPTVSSQTLRLALSPSSSTVASVRSAVISDAAAARASVRFADDERTLVEAACGASLALCYDPALLHSLVPELRAGGDGSEGKRVLVVVCGGSNVSLEVLEGYRRKYGMLDGTESHRGVEKIGRVQSLL